MRKRNRIISDKKSIQIGGQDIYVLGMMMALISFLGFVVENLWLAVTKGYMNNRNMNAPFLLGYGVLVLVMYFLFGTPGKMRGVRKRGGRKRQYAMYFLCAMLFVCVGEIVLGILVEHLCGIEYWNYSGIPLHITKYTSIPTSAAFASMITLFMGNCFDPLIRWISRMDYRVLKVLSVLLVTVMLWDYLVSFGMMIRKKDFYRRWKLILWK